MMRQYFFLKGVVLTLALLCSSCGRTPNSTDSNQNVLSSSHSNDCNKCEALFEFIKNSFQTPDVNDAENTYYRCEYECSSLSDLVLKARINPENESEDIFCFETSSTYSDYDFSLFLKMYGKEECVFKCFGEFFSEETTHSIVDYKGNINSNNFSKETKTEIEFNQSSITYFDSNAAEHAIIEAIDLLLKEMNNVFADNNLGITMKDFGFSNY